MVKEDIKLNDFSDAFLKFFWDKLIKTSEEKYFLNNLLSMSDVFIFGGVIRDYFLLDKSAAPRDIDLVVSVLNDKIKSLLKPYIIKQNQFGGYRLKIQNTIYDIWSVENTWSYQNNYRMHFDLNTYLPATSFFNLTAIIFSLNSCNFYYKKSFTKAIERKILDIVNIENPFPELCIVKSYEYKIKFNMTFSNKLQKFISTNYPKVKANILEIQKKHYGKIIFTTNEIESFVKKLTNSNDKRCI